MNKQRNKQDKTMNLINYIYDEEFIGLINRLSAIIREYFNNYELYINNLRTQYDSINEQTLFSKSAINDILQYLNQSKPKLSVNTSEKYLREKAYVISERIDKIIDIKNNIGQNVRSSDLKYTSFFNEAKDLFKKMKLVRSRNIDEINAQYKYDDYMEKKRDKYSSQSPKGKFIGGGGILEDKRRPYHQHEHNNSITMDPLASSMNKRGDSFSPFGSITNSYMGMGNQLSGSLTIEDVMRKNETLIAEITLIKYKHNELEKENKTLKDKMMKIRQGNVVMKSCNYGSIDTIPFKKNIIDNMHDSFNASGRLSQAKSRSLSKKSNNNYVCNTTSGNEPEKDSNIHNKAKPSSAFNTLQSSSNSACNNPTNNEGRGNVVVKRAFSIGSKTKSTNSNSHNHSRQSRESSSSKQQNPLTLSSSSNSQMPCLSNSNSTINNLCINNSTAGNSTFNTSFPNNSTLATLVLSFLSQMKSLQENIANRSDTVKEMKKSFEIKKRELIKLSETIISAGINNMTMTASSTITKKQPLPHNTITNKSHNPPIIDTSKLDVEIAQLKQLNQESEAKLIKEKSMITHYETKLNDERNKAQVLNELLNALQLQIKELTRVNIEHTNTIESFDRTKKDLLKVIQTHQETMSLLEKENESYKEKYETIMQEATKTNHEITKLTNDNQALRKDITKLTEENKALKYEINTNQKEIISLNELQAQAKNTITSIIKSNEELLNEKDSIIKTMTSNTSELKKEIEALSNDLTIRKEKIVALQKEIKDLEGKLKENNNTISTIQKTRIGNEKDNDNDDLIKSLKESLNKYQKDLASSKHENRELLNKIAQIKNEYLSYDEEKEEIKRILIELNSDTDYNIKAFQAQTNKLEGYKNEYSARLQEKLKEHNLIDINKSTNDYINTISLIKNYNEAIKLNTDLLETKIKEASLLLSSSNDPIFQQKYNELLKEITILKEERQTFIGKESEVENNNNPNKTLSDINEQNSNFLNDEPSNDSEIFFEEKEEEKESISQGKGNNNPKPNPHPINPTHHKQCMSLPNIVHTEQLSIERKQSHSSLHSNDDGKYQTALKQVEESENLLKNQLALIKNELKVTIEERNQLKKKCKDSSEEMSKDELISILKQTFEKLVDLIQITDKVKDYVMMIFKLLNYTDEAIQKIMMKKDKKTLFGIFKK